MRSAVRSLLERKDVLERFEEVLSKNPEKYVLMTETGGGVHIRLRGGTVEAC